MLIKKQRLQQQQQQQEQQDQQEQHHECLTFALRSNLTTTAYGAYNRVSGGGGGDVSGRYPAYIVVMRSFIY